jgi:hypothetical protein
MTRVAVFLLVATVAGCATPYREVDATGGYSHQRLDENVYKITFQGNSATGYERARDFAFLRAAEVCTELGYTHFLIEGQEDRSEVMSFDTGSASYTSGTVSGTTNTSPNTMRLTKPGVELVVRYFDSMPTERHLKVFESQSVIRELGQEYKLNIGVSTSGRPIADADNKDEPPLTARESHETPVERVYHPQAPNAPNRKIITYRLARDASGDFATDQDGNLIIIPIYEDEQEN